MYIAMSRSGSSDSRWRSWATTRFATWSSIGSPRKTTRSRSSREEMSKERSPRESCSTTMGTRGTGLLLSLATGEPVENGAPGEAPLVPDPTPRELSLVREGLDGGLVGLEELGHVGQRHYLRDLIGQERVLAHDQ